MPCKTIINYLHLLAAKNIVLFNIFPNDKVLFTPFNRTAQWSRRGHPTAASRIGAELPEIYCRQSSVTSRSDLHHSCAVQTSHHCDHAPWKTTISITNGGETLNVLLKNVRDACILWYDMMQFWKYMSLMVADDCIDIPLTENSLKRIRNCVLLLPCYGIVL